MDGLTDAIEPSAIVQTVIKSAPVLASVLASPLASIGLQLLGNLFGVDFKKVNELKDAISADPEASIKIKTLEYNHIESLTYLASQTYATEVEDRKNARSNAVLYKDFLRHMAYLVTIGFFGALIFLFVPLPLNTNPEERELLSMLIGMLVSKWQTIIDFFYGSHHKQGESK